ncbi:hypothetical protein HID58_018209 [Brassica napus]|uniref:Uncharacterized protein n=1 Tax=Brassica napus TaxID=3708 RepID=A0ABQ8D9R2_BRANA|nr:hypothetical protein HID58_018209 [Brassica napus]
MERNLIKASTEPGSVGTGFDVVSNLLNELNNYSVSLEDFNLVSGKDNGKVENWLEAEESSEDLRKNWEKVSGVRMKKEPLNADLDGSVVPSVTSDSISDNLVSPSQFHILADLDDNENGVEELEEGELLPDTEQVPKEKVANHAPKVPKGVANKAMKHGAKSTFKTVIRTKDLKFVKATTSKKVSSRKL